MARRTYKGYTHTENGWPIVDRDDIEVTKLPLMNNVQIELLRGDVSTVLVAWMIWYHQNVRRIDLYQPRDEWGYSWDNSVPNSNHLSGTAVDINATETPMGLYRLAPEFIGKINEGLRLFEDNIFWGRLWSGSNVDEMHFQIRRYDPATLAAFAAKLRSGYLGIYAPADPNAFPLPTTPGWYGPTWFYGPLEGPEQSISGRYSNDLPAWIEGLKRWQAAAGVPVTGVWDDATRDFCKRMQIDKGWQPAATANGYLYQGEWDAVIRDAWKPPITFPNPPKECEVQGVYFADVSQWQPLVDDSYPYRVLSIRSNSGNAEDRNFRENYRRALDMVARGKLDFIIVYYFFRPGQANCDLWKQLVTVNGSVPNSVVCMVDVEGDGGKIRGDQSWEVNDEIDRVRKWLGNARRVIGYHNQKADPGLWLVKPNGGIRMVVPWYNNDIARAPEYTGAQRIAHQFSDRYDVKPFGPCDINFANLTISQFREQVGIAPR